MTEHAHALMYRKLSVLPSLMTILISGGGTVSVCGMEEAETQRASLLKVTAVKLRPIWLQLGFFLLILTGSRARQVWKELFSLGTKSEQYDEAIFS